MCARSVSHQQMERGGWDAQTGGERHKTLRPDDINQCGLQHRTCQQKILRAYFLEAEFTPGISSLTSSGGSLQQVALEQAIASYGRVCMAAQVRRAMLRCAGRVSSDERLPRWILIVQKTTCSAMSLKGR